MKIKSILIVVDEYPTSFGHTTVIKETSVRLQKIGYRVGIGAFGFKEEPPVNIEKIILDKKILFSRKENLKFDIIHLHQPKMTYFFLFKKIDTPVILHYHGSSNLIQRLNFKISMKLFHKKIKKIIPVSNTALNQIKKMSKNIPPAKVVFNGVDYNFFANNKSKEFKKGIPQLIFVGGLRNYKKIDELISIIPKLIIKYSNVHLQIIGEGIEFSKLNQNINEKKLQKFVELVGKQSRENISSRLSSSDIYVSASRFETFSLSPLEAMASGLPVVLSEHPAHKELIEKSNAGKIFSYNDTVELCLNIEEVFENKEYFSKNANYFAMNNDWDHMISQMIETYQQVFDDYNTDNRET
jgi:L-malate glycosyltransferase